MPVADNRFGTSRQFGISSHVKAERSGWRDAEFSGRHRTVYGTDCPMVDGDFICTEYDYGTTVAIIDYKRCDDKPPPVLSKANESALLSMGNPAGIPVAVIYYWSPSYAFVAVPLNTAANEVFAPRCEWLTERQYVRRLIAMRGRNPDQREQCRGVGWDALMDEMPPPIAREWFGAPSRPLPAAGNRFRFTGKVFDTLRREVTLMPLVHLPPVIIRSEDGSPELLEINRKEVKR